MRNEQVTISYRATDVTTGDGYSGDSLNHTLYIIRDGVKTPATNAPFDLGGGDYAIVVNADENSGEMMAVTGESSTPNIILSEPSWRNLTQEEIDELTASVEAQQSYLNVAQAQDYFDNRLYTGTWDNATSADRLKALKMATRDIDRLNYKSSKTDENQVLEFPRGGSTEVPQAILNACCELALKYLDGVDPDEEQDKLSVTSQGFASARSTYDRATVPEHLRAGIVSAKAWAELKPYLADVQTVNFSRVS